MFVAIGFQPLDELFANCVGWKADGPIPIDTTFDGGTEFMGLVVC